MAGAPILPERCAAPRCRGASVLVYLGRGCCQSHFDLAETGADLRRLLGIHRHEPPHHAAHREPTYALHGARRGHGLAGDAPAANL